MVDENVVREAMKKVNIKADVDALSLGGDFSEFGLDSLDIYDLLLEMQELTGIEVSDSDIKMLTTINSVVQYFSR